MEVKAIAKNIRVSIRKLKPIVQAIKDLEPQKALVTLSFINKSAARPLAKVIASAIANARHNFGVKEESLRFKKIEIGKGRILKRYRAVAKGRVHQISKRTANIKIVLEGEPKEEAALSQEVQANKSADSGKHLKKETTAKSEHNKNL